jgi:hypothetical protein
MYTPRRGRAIVALALSAVFVCFVGCSDDDSPTGPEPYNPNEYLLSLPSWEEYSPVLPDEEVVGDPVPEIDWSQNLVCKRSECSLTKTPEDIVTYNPGSEILYLGSLIQGDSYIGGVGSIAELPIRERAPLTVTIDLHVDDSSRTVNNPTAATVGDAIHALVAAADAAGHNAGSSIFYNQVTCHSLEQSALSLGMSARYMGASVRASLEAERTHEESSITAYFVQRMFTTSVVLPDQPGDFFSSSFTKEMMDEQIRRGRIGPDNLPVYVSNIVWGRLMVLTMTSSMEASRMQAALQASYAGISGSVGAEHLETLQQSEIKLVTVGGDAQAALDFLRSGNLGEFFKDDAPLTTAVPLTYTLRNLGDNSIAKVSETTSYELMECSDLGVVVTQSDAEWRNMVLSAGFDVHELMTTAENVALADEVASPPGKNQGISGVLTWQGATTGFPFDFVLTTFAGITYWDDEGFGRNTLSIGDIDNAENDDFHLEVTGTDVYALAIWIHDNTSMSGEDVTIWGATPDGGEEYIEQLPRGYNGFFGVVSPVPLRRIEFNEDSGGDDIAVYGFRFAVDTN